MCGINAIIRKNSSGPSLNVESIQKMANAIEHRGPDEAGHAVLGRGRVLLGHVRLSIIDLKSGQQPMFTDDGRIAISFNGELYDYQIHRSELEKKGVHFNTTSDTEVLLKLYEHYGVDAFSKLNGEFAFTIWDSKKNLFFAVRDRMGVKPLFYYEDSKYIALSSEVKSIYQLDFVNREFNPNYFIGNFMGAFSSTRTPFYNIHHVFPGHYLVINSSGEILQNPYWEPTFEIDNTIDFDLAKKQVNSLLRDAVSRRMVADVPVGCYLSGGIDSTLICGLMAEQAKSFKAFNVGFRATEYDESSLAEKIAKHYGAEFETIDCNSDKLAQDFEKTVHRVEMPFANPNAIAKQILSSLVRSQGYKVCITGEGSDEVFGGYAYFKQEMILKMLREGQNCSKRLKTLYKEFKLKEKRSKGLLWSTQLDPNTESPLNFPNFHYLRTGFVGQFSNKMFSEEVLSQARFNKPIEYINEEWDFNLLNQLDPLNATKRVTYHQLSNYIIPTLGDRVEMANSVECRTPFLDKDLLEGVSKIPTEHFIDIWNLKEKNLLRESLKGVLPEFMFEESKHPFLSPNWKRLSKSEVGKDKFKELIHSNRLKDARVFNPSFIRKLSYFWSIYPQRSVTWRNVDTLMGMIFTTQSLHDQFIANRPECTHVISVERFPLKREPTELRI